MEININLLPRPERKRYDLILVILLLFCLVVGGGTYGTITFNSLIEKKEFLQNELSKQAQIKDATYNQVQFQVNEITESNYADYWEKLHIYMQHIYINPHTIISEIQVELPSQAKINRLSFQLDGQVIVDVTFQTMEDVSFFLESLLESTLIIDAQVSNVQTIDQINSISSPPSLRDDIDQTESNLPTKSYRGEFILTVKTLGGDRND